MVRVSNVPLRASRPGVLENVPEPVRTVIPDPSGSRESRRSEPTIPTERMIDLTLDHSFPASDPPSWTLGI